MKQQIKLVTGAPSPKPPKSYSDYKARMQYLKVKKAEFLKLNQLARDLHREYRDAKRQALRVRDEILDVI